MRSALDQKEGVLCSLEEELTKARQCNEQIDQDCHRCDVDLCLYSEHVKQLSDRWKRIKTQINSRQDERLLSISMLICIYVYIYFRCSFLTVNY